jgi:glycosyltransferase involved in cell wall biosynthesis
MKSGFLIRTGDVATASQRLLQLANNAALREQFGKHGQQIVVEQFSVERMINTLHKLYLDLARAKGISAA